MQRENWLADAQLRRNIERERRKCVCMCVSARVCATTFPKKRTSHQAFQERIANKFENLMHSETYIHIQIFLKFFQQECSKCKMEYNYAISSRIISTKTINENIKYSVKNHSFVWSNCRLNNISCITCVAVSKYLRRRFWVCFLVI